MCVSALSSEIGTCSSCAAICSGLDKTGYRCACHRSKHLWRPFRRRSFHYSSWETSTPIHPSPCGCLLVSCFFSCICVILAFTLSIFSCECIYVVLCFIAHVCMCMCQSRRIHTCVLFATTCCNAQSGFSCCTQPPSGHHHSHSQEPRGRTTEQRRPNLQSSSFVPPPKDRSQPPPSGHDRWVVVILPPSPCREPTAATTTTTECFSCGSCVPPCHSSLGSVHRRGYAGGAGGSSSSSSSQSSGFSGTGGGVRPSSAGHRGRIPPVAAAGSGFHSNAEMFGRPSGRNKARRQREEETVRYRREMENLRRDKERTVCVNVDGCHAFVPPSIAPAETQC